MGVGCDYVIIDCCGQGCHAAKAARNDEERERRRIFMKRIGLVFLGLVVGFIVSEIVTEVMIQCLEVSSGDDTQVWIPFFVGIPVGFLVGSIVTGWFCFHELESKGGLVFMAPALYVNLIAFPLAIMGPMSIFLMALYWYAMSLGGVAMGYFVRYKVYGWWCSD